MDEAAFIRSIQTEGNRNAFAFLVRRYQSSLRSYLRNMCRGNIEWADDLAQESFLKAFKGIKSFDGRSKFSTWLFQIARNAYFDDVKRSRPTESLEDSEACSPNMDLKLDLNSALRTIPESEREVILLNYVEGFSHDEIAAITACPIGTVKSRLLQAKEKLAKAFSEVTYAI